MRTSIVTEHPSREITLKMVCATCAQRCLGVRWENSLASAARSDDKIKFEKLKLDERSIVHPVTPLNISHIAIVILDVFNVQCACNHVNDAFFAYPDRAKTKRI